MTTPMFATGHIRLRAIVHTDDAGRGIESCNGCGCGYETLQQKCKKHDRAGPGALSNPPLAKAMHGY